MDASAGRPVRGWRGRLGWRSFEELEGLEVGLGVAAGNVGAGALDDDLIEAVFDDVMMGPVEAVLRQFQDKLAARVFLVLADLERLFGVDLALEGGGGAIAGGVEDAFGGALVHSIRGQV